MAIEFGGIPSTIFFGWISDRLEGRRGMVATLCMIPIIAAFAAITVIPRGYLWLDFSMLAVIGFFVYPVINLIVISALDIVSKKAIGTAAGFIGLFGYLGKMVQSAGSGRIVDNYEAAGDIAGGHGRCGLRLRQRRLVAAHDARRPRLVECRVDRDDGRVLLQRVVTAVVEQCAQAGEPDGSEQSGHGQRRRLRPVR